MWGTLGEALCGAGGRWASSRHCEERSDAAIQGRGSVLDCFASLAMTALFAVQRSSVEKVMERVELGNARRERPYKGTPLASAKARSSSRIEAAPVFASIRAPTCAAISLASRASSMAFTGPIEAADIERPR
ncbi:MAG: hypothetical protein JWM36_1293 [Hyphomicrobiales bacterium]|nr:hypothetical protein [Hyphomicrobiales bacterium]